MYYTLLTDNTAESVTENIQQEVATQTSFAVDFFHENLPKAINFGVGVVFALIFFLIGRILINWVRKLVRASIERSAADKGVEQFVDSCLKTESIPRQSRLCLLPVVWQSVLPSRGVSQILPEGY